MSTQPPSPPAVLQTGVFQYRRELTREVAVGDCTVGGSHRIRVQSMTTTNTQDVGATVDQAEALVGAGCEIVRITAPSLRDAEALAEIRRELDRRGVRVPLVADIHFTPNAALKSAEAVEKVRVNPGNFADKKKFEVREYSDAAYREELDRVADRFRPLVLRLKQLGRALRIGTNHGSLSDRILNRYGDTPRGMVESALEFLEVCEAENFYSVIFSMKASNPQVAIHAYRLLAERLRERSPDTPRYPFHVGVTEAGDGEDGRTKSAIGIGALLEDGLGETLRVSLTEDPVREIPVARALADRFDTRVSNSAPEFKLSEAYCAERTAYLRRPSCVVEKPLSLGGDQAVRVELCRGPARLVSKNFARQLAAATAATDLSVESVLFDAGLGDEASLKALAEDLSALRPAVPLALRVRPEHAAALAAFADRLVLPLEEIPEEQTILQILREVGGSTALEFELRMQSGDYGRSLDAVSAAVAGGESAPLISLRSELPVQANRVLAAQLSRRGLAWPVVLRGEPSALEALERVLLATASDIGSMLCDGIGDCISVGGLGSLADSLRAAYRILQGARRRTSWTEFISCPSCGRTLFDLEEVTARIKERTSHLPGLKIAVMGCVVNGPGEMVDADFGYVGSGHGKVSLYVGYDCVVRNIGEAEAPDRLVELIRDRGHWVEPS